MVKKSATARICAALLYYLFLPLAFYLTLKAPSLLMRTDNLGEAIAFTYALAFLGFPCLTAILMRLSPLPWIVDPFAAMETALILPVFCALSWLSRGDGFVSALAQASRFWGYSLFLFIFALVCSISPKRARGIRLIERGKALFR
jgi:hypothetical protein